MKYELEIVKGKITTDPLNLVEPVMNGAQLLHLQDEINKIYIHDAVYQSVSYTHLIRKDTARKDRLPQDPHLELVECSLEELAALPEKVTGSFDTFYHIAWGYTGAARNKSTRLQSKNIDYTLDLSLIHISYAFCRKSDQASLL